MDIKKINTIKGILFDMDGVLFNSEEIIAKAGVEFFRRRNMNVSPSDFVPFIGTGELNFLQGVAQPFSIAIDNTSKLELYEIYDDYAKTSLIMYSGVEKVLEKAKSSGLKIALATSADMSKVKTNFNLTGKKMHIFDEIISGNDVVNKKPNPEIFIKASNRLKLNENEVVVIEDSLTGLEAAKAAGCKSIGLATTFNKSQLKNCDAIAENFEDIYSILF